MKSDQYVKDYFEKHDLAYIHNVGREEMFMYELNTLYINPIYNEYDCVLDHLGVNPQDIEDPHGLEKLIMEKLK